MRKKIILFLLLAVFISFFSTVAYAARNTKYANIVAGEQGSSSSSEETSLTDATGSSGGFAAWVGSTIMQSVTKFVFTIARLVKKIVVQLSNWLFGVDQFPWADLIAFNTLPYLDINFFNSSDGSVFSGILAGIVQQTYFSLLTLALAILGIGVTIVAIKLAVSSIAAEKAKYKEAITRCLYTVVMLFSVHILLSFIFYLNEQICVAASELLISMVGDQEGIDKYLTGDYEDAFEYFKNLNFQEYIVLEYDLSTTEEWIEVLMDRCDADNEFDFLFFALSNSKFKDIYTEYNTFEGFKNCMLDNMEDDDGDTLREIIEAHSKFDPQGKLTTSWDDVLDLEEKYEKYCSKYSGDDEEKNKFIATCNFLVYSFADIDGDYLYERTRTHNHEDVDSIEGDDERPGDLWYISLYSNDAVEHGTDIEYASDYYDTIQIVLKDAKEICTAKSSEDIESYFEEFGLDEIIVEQIVNFYKTCISEESASTIISDLGTTFEASAYNIKDDNADDSVYIAVYLYAIFIVQSLTLLISYLKRIFYVIILSVLAPIVVIYDFFMGETNKVFNTWIKELCSLVFVQSMQAILLTVMLALVVKLYTGTSNDNSVVQESMGLYAIFIMIIIPKVELLVKKVFGLGSGVSDVSMSGGKNSLLKTGMALRLGGRVLNNAGKMVGGAINVGSGLVGAGRKQSNIAKNNYEATKMNGESGSPQKKLGNTTSNRGSRLSENNQSLTSDSLTQAIRNANAKTPDELKQEADDAKHKRWQQVRQGMQQMASGALETAGAVGGASLGAVLSMGTGGDDLLTNMVTGAGIGDAVGESVTNATLGTANRVTDWNYERKQLNKKVNASKEKVRATDEYRKTLNEVKNVRNSSVSKSNSQKTIRKPELSQTQKANNEVVKKMNNLREQHAVNAKVSEILGDKQEQKNYQAKMAQVEKATEEFKKQNQVKYKSSKGSFNKASQSITKEKPNNDRKNSNVSYDKNNNRRQDKQSHTIKKDNKVTNEKSSMASSSSASSSSVDINRITKNREKANSNATYSSDNSNVSSEKENNINNNDVE